MFSETTGRRNLTRQLQNMLCGSGQTKPKDKFRFGPRANLLINNYYGLDQIPHANLLVLVKSINFLSSGRNIYTWSCLFILFCTEPVSVHFRRCCFKRAVVQKKFDIFLFHEPKKSSLIVR